MAEKSSVGQKINGVALIVSKGFWSLRKNLRGRKIFRGSENQWCRAYCFQRILEPEKKLRGRKKFSGSENPWRRLKFPKDSGPSDPSSVKTTSVADVPGRKIYSVDQKIHCPGVAVQVSQG